MTGGRTGQWWSIYKSAEENRLWQKNKYVKILISSTPNCMLNVRNILGTLGSIHNARNIFICTPTRLSLAENHQHYHNISMQHQDKTLDLFTRWFLFCWFAIYCTSTCFACFIPHISWFLPVCSSHFIRHTTFLPTNLNLVVEYERRILPEIKEKIRHL